MIWAHSESGMRKSRMGTSPKTGQLIQRVFREYARPNSVQVRQPEMKQVHHPFDIDIHRLNAHLILEAEERHLSRVCDGEPGGGMGFHQGEQGPHHLSQHGREVGGRVLGIMNLGPEKTLTHLGSARNGLGRHPNVDPEARHIGFPDMLLEIVLGQFSGESEISADRLTDLLPVEGSGQGIGDAVGDGPVVLVASIVRGHIVVAFFDESDEGAVPSTRV